MLSGVSASAVLLIDIWQEQVADIVAFARPQTVLGVASASGRALRLRTPEFRRQILMTDRRALGALVLARPLSLCGPRVRE